MKTPEYLIDDDTLGEKVGKATRKAGRTVAHPVLLMYLVLKDKNAPSKEKIPSSQLYAIFQEELLHTLTRD